VSSKRTPQYHRGARSNCGVVMPQFLLHAALQELPQKLRSGTYGNDSRQERLVQTLSYELMDQSFHKLQQRPPSLSLNFPVEPLQLPQLTIVRESMTEENPIIGHDAGPVEQDMNLMENVVLIASATGGETTFQIPCVGNPVPSTIELLVTRGGTPYTELRYEYGDFNVNINERELVLTDALLAGDGLTIVRAAARGLAGGNLHAVTFRFSCVIFIEAENPIVTSVLEALVWRELQLKHDALISEGLVDIDFGFRQLSQWSQIVPAIGFRSEMVVTGLVAWMAFDAASSSEGSLLEHATVAVSGTTGAGEDIGEMTMHSDLVYWDRGSEE